MVANTPNGRVPHIGGGVALLPLGPNGEKWGVDDLLAEGYNWGDIQAFIYPMNQVFDLKTGKFSPAPGLLPPVSHSGFGTVAIICRSLRWLSFSLRLQSPTTGW